MRPHPLVAPGAWLASCLFACEPQTAPPDFATPAPATPVSSCLDTASPALSLLVDPIEGNHTTVELSIAVHQPLSNLVIDVGETEGHALYTWRLGDRPRGTWLQPVAGLMPERSGWARATWTEADGSEACSDTVRFQTRAVDPLGMPQFSSTLGVPPQDSLSFLLLVFDDGIPRLGMLRGETWVGVLDLGPEAIFGRRMRVTQDGHLEVLNEVFSAVDRCQIATFDVGFRELGRETFDLTCHHSFQDVDVDRDGTIDRLFLGVEPGWVVEVDGKMEPIYADMVVRSTPTGLEELLAYRPFVDVDQALLDQMAENYDPYALATQIATYANTLECTTFEGGPQCLFGLNLAHTGVVHLDLERGMVNVIENEGMRSFTLQQEESLPEKVGLTWTGLEKLPWNQTAASKRRTGGGEPFSGLHNAEVLGWDGETQRMRIISHDRAFNMEELIFASSAEAEVATSTACAQTVIYDIDLREGVASVVDARGETLRDGRCAHSLYTGDVSVIGEDGGGTRVTSLYSGFQTTDPAEEVPPVLVSYRISAEGKLEIIGKREASAVPYFVAFHTSVLLCDLATRLGPRP